MDLVPLGSDFDLLTLLSRSPLINLFLPLSLVTSSLTDDPYLILPASSLAPSSFPPPPACLLP